MTLTRDFTPYDSRSGNVSNPVRRAFAKSWGAEYVGDDRVLFRLWAPDLERLRLRIDGRNREMLPAGNGWFTLTVEGTGPGTRYNFVMPDGKVMADPASRAQDGGINAASLVVDPTTYRWIAADWQGHSWDEAVLHELNIGTFTPEGTFRAAIARLPELAARGITMLQLTPVNRFSGGVDEHVPPYAPHHAYGSPDDMKAFADAAHRHGLSVMLDVVYTNAGLNGLLFDPYLPSFFEQGREALQEGVKKPAIDHGQSAVRSFFIENALYWLEEFNLDGLRLDAVERIADATSPVHFLAELSERVRENMPGRARHLVTGNHGDLASYLEQRILDVARKDGT
jgi:malto-oligosyltrehalose trehalohydrolase